MGGNVSYGGESGIKPRRRPRGQESSVDLCIVPILLGRWRNCMDRI